MENPFVVLLLVFALSSCATSSDKTGLSAEDSLNNWAFGFEEKNLDTLMSAYWPEASITFTDPNGEEIILKGEDIIREMQRGSIEDPTPYIVHTDEAEYVMVEDLITYTVLVEREDHLITNFLDFHERDGEWRIITQTIEF